MIPHTIHYCWFGRKALPHSARKCIASWKKYFPNYEIREWNEDNFDVNMIPYTAGAYAEKKYAFVSDFARFWVLYHNGGVYFDTDVEVIRPMDDIIEKGSFMGIEAKTSSDQDNLFVNPGMGMACISGDKIWEKIVHLYTSFNSFFPDKTVCEIVTKLLRDLSIPIEPDGIDYNGFTLYPADYFCPQAMMGAPIKLTEHTRSIHHFDASWLPTHVRWRVRLLGMLPVWLSSFLRRLKKI